MTQVPVRELNQNTAGVLVRVKGGEEVEITERGTIIARLVPAQPSPVASLIASGNSIPPRSQLRAGTPADRTSQD
jgi:prevent-host-death family protein